MSERELAWGSARRLGVLGVVLGIILAGVAILAAIPLLAHHGTAIYQMDQYTTIKGTIVDYELVNPHVQMSLKVAQPSGDPVVWSVEGVSMNMMVRAGFRRDSLKAGDAVTITGHPGKNGRTVLLLTKIVLADGKELSAPYE